MRALVAEDDPISRRLLEAMLVKWGYELIVASSGEEAWRLLQEEDAPRLVILDWMMPGMDGVQICREIRKQEGRPYTYIVLLTAKNEKQDAVEGLHAGADDYVAKPFNPQELKVRLRAGKRVLDLQSELLAARAELQERATHDSLTGLPNRLLFADRLNQCLAAARRRKDLLAVMFLDLDRFKLINDTLGHNAGDQLLRKVADRLKTCLREGDTLARMGGDEFTITLADMQSERDAVAVAQRALDALTDQFLIAGHELFISTSIGISLFPAHGSDVETLVKNADAAMYRAKEQGRNCYKVFSGSLNVDATARVRLESGLRKAIDKDQLVLHYQPRVDIRSGRITGGEALVRWQHPELGLLPPDQFIPVAEETGLIVGLTEWVLRTACDQNMAWQRAGHPIMDVAVNVSARHFQNASLLTAVENALHSSGLAAECLCLELTENALTLNPEAAAGVLRDLKSMGVRLAIDDFGAGRASLNYLKRFPVDVVKIDRSFVRDLTTDPNDAAIAGAVVAMAHSLKLKVVAEGVETLEQLDFLRSLNCDEMQGYFVSRPVRPAAFADLLMEPVAAVIGS
ncbi:MAG: EAL domain-containing protein [Armatimonadota bacterium]|nr:EAL domain-containing protein [Armatimonadota bacterium]